MSGNDDELAPTNRPGLERIDYRIGTHSTILERMLERLHRQEVPPEGSGADSTRRPLRKLSTRETDDPTVALLDAWATVADVLTFYQERLANEQYVRTARERFSLVELARLVGYEPDPGLAASAALAFEVDDSPKGPAEARVPAGTPVQSIPEKGELPQTFETSADFVARPEWNAVTPRSDRPQHLALDEDGNLYLVDSDGTLVGGGDRDSDTGKTEMALDELYFVGPDLPLGADLQASADLADKTVRVVGTDVFYLDGIHEDLRRGDPILLVGKLMEAVADGDFGDTGWFWLKRVAGVTPQPQMQRTVIQVEEFDTTSGGSGVQPYAYVQPTFYFAEALHVAKRRHKRAGTSGGDDVLVAARPKSELQYKTTIRNSGYRLAEANEASRDAQSQPKELAFERGVVVFDETVGFFGNNAPSHDAVKNAYDDNPFGDAWDGVDEYEIWDHYTADANEANKERKSYAKADVFLERVVDGVEPGEWVVFDGRSAGGDARAQRVYQVDMTTDQSVQGFSLSTRATGLELSEVMAAKSHTQSEQPNSGKEFGVRSTSAHVGNRVIELAQVPMPDRLGALKSIDGEERMVGSDTLQLDGIYLGFEVGKQVVIGGRKLRPHGVQAHEVARIDEVTHTGANTILRFKEKLDNAYLRDTVVVYANVATATHGESVTEVLGSGDSSRPNQSFVLRQPPLTYVAASGGSGRKSTLEVRVDGVLWEEVDSFRQAGPIDRVYAVEVDESGDTRVIFGDGRQGARLPSGEENVVAHYRSGIGLDGQVGEERLTLLKQRPEGIRRVTNPVAAGDAADPESREDLRANAPRDTRLLERIVSLQDYADFALSFPGVGKARAELLSKEGRTRVHLTVGAVSTEGGAQLGESRLGDLTASIRQSSANRYPVRVRNLEPARFGVKATLRVRDGHPTEAVLRRVRRSLEAAYAYEARAFLEPVSAASVIATIHADEAVLSVTLERLWVVGGREGGVLEAKGTRWSESQRDWMAAQLLFIEPDAIDLSTT